MATTSTASFSRFKTFNEAILSALVPDLKFASGTWDTISTEVINDQECVFAFILQPITFRRDRVDDSFDTADVLMQFGIRDSSDSTSQEHANIIESMEILVEQFLREAQDLSNDYGIEYTGISKEPYYKQFGQNISGLYLRFNVNVNTCLPFSWSDMSSFAGEISRKISPFNWSNYAAS